MVMLVAVVVVNYGGDGVCVCVFTLPYDTTSHVSTETMRGSTVCS